MADGSRATGIAVVLRNLIRIPEAMFLYVPSGLACLASPRRQRLGDHVARTVVVRRPARVTGAYRDPGRAQPFGRPPVTPPVGRSGHAAPAAGLARRDLAGGPRPTGRADPRAAGARTPRSHASRPPPSPHAAHTLTYLTFSERELAAAGGGEQTGDYSEAYISAWFTLTDAVAALKDARAGLEPAAAAAGLTPGQAAAAHPDLVHLLTELGPYFSAADDDSVHAAFLAVARAEAAPS